jgi:HAD superfamily phosphatase (TIGR01668 family)
MTWGNLLQPDLALQASVLHLKPEILRQYDLRGLILDVDETLVPLQATEASAELRQWVAEVRQVAKLALLSNNLSANRIARIAQSLDLPYFYGAGKPSRRKLKQAVEQLQIPVERIAMVGDRLFTDVLAGNRLGMFTILVEPIPDSRIAGRLLYLRSVEVWISQALGVSLQKSHNATNTHKSIKDEI